MKTHTMMDDVRSSVIGLISNPRDEENEFRSALDALVREGARMLLETALEIEVEEFLGRARYERGERKRNGYRNGSARRTVKTLAGELMVKKPKVCDTEEPFRSQILKAWQRRSDEMSDLIPRLYMEGLSTRDFQRALRTFWGESGLSKSTMSRLNLRLHEEFQQWRERDLGKEELLFLYLDALFAGVRFGTSEKEAVLVAHGYRRDGSRAVLAISLGGRESAESWSEVLHDLERRGLPRPGLVISDGNKGLIAAVKAAWPDQPRQRCVAHRTRNILDKVPKGKQDEARRALNAIWYAECEAEAREKAKSFVATFGRTYEAATECLLECLPDCLTFYRYPKEYWRHIRTSNLLERTFREVRRRTRVIGRFPTEGSALAVIYGVLTLTCPKWHCLNLGPLSVEAIQNASRGLRDNPIGLDFIQEAA
jgi:putative transposase